MTNKNKLALKFGLICAGIGWSFPYIIYWLCAGEFTRSPVFGLICLASLVFGLLGFIVGCGVVDALLKNK